MQSYYHLGPLGYEEGMVLLIEAFAREKKMKNDFDNDHCIIPNVNYTFFQQINIMICVRPILC